MGRLDVQPAVLPVSLIGQTNPGASDAFTLPGRGRASATSTAPSTTLGGGA
jgi:hypothetical protein